MEYNRNMTTKVFILRYATSMGKPSQEIRVLQSHNHLKTALEQETSVPT